MDLALGAVGSTRPALTADANGLIAAWQTQLDALTTSVTFAGWDATGRARFPTRTLLSRTPFGAADPAVAHGSLDTLVVWASRWDASRSVPPSIQAVRVDASGAVRDASVLPVSNAAKVAGHPSVASNGRDFFVAFEAGPSDDDLHVAGARVDATGRVLDARDLAISTSANSEATPAVAFDGTNHLVVWSDARLGHDKDLYAVRVAPDGTVLDREPFLVSGTSGDAVEPDVVFDGTTFRIVWADGRNGAYDVYGTRVTPAGTVLDPGGVALASSGGEQRRPRVASDGASVLVVWEDARSGVDFDVRARFVAPTGSSPSQEFAVASSAGDQRAPSVGVHDGTFLVAWQDARLGTVDVRGARVASDGTVRDTTALVLGRLAANQESPSVVATPSGWVVAWSSFARVRSESDLASVSVAADGTVGTARIVVSGTGEERNVRLFDAADGENLLAVWEDAGATGRDVRAALVTFDGAIRTGGSVDLATSPEDESAPAVSAAPGGRALAVYTRFDGGPGFGATRVRARTFDTGAALGSPCASAGECRSRSCVDGTCCASACDGACSTCATPTGACVPVRNAEDPGTCDSGLRCDADAVCRATVTTRCARPTDCLSGYCVDGVCCDSACDGGCDACNLVPGVCTAVSAGSTGSRPACAPFVCDGVSRACPTACTNDAQCGAGLFCAAGGRCVPRRDAGATCDPGTECNDPSRCAPCAAGACVDGVCCNRACEGQCEACDVPGSVGSCVPVDGAPHGARTACEPGTDTCTAKVCAGRVNAASCVFVASGVPCRGASCKEGVESAPATCDGSGRCGSPGQGTTRACAPFACGADACKTTCATDDDCARGSTCDRAKGTCISGALCVDANTLRTASGREVSCGPYTCQGSACRTTRAGRGLRRGVLVRRGRAVRDVRGREGGGGCAVGPDARGAARACFRPRCSWGSSSSVRSRGAVLLRGVGLAGGRGPSGGSRPWPWPSSASSSRSRATRPAGRRLRHRPARPSRR
ncbi:MAG: hypothetical protein U0169_04835 [Polyangiaceae bacterium]